ncbi:MAG: hypothetical protein HDR92_00905 [Bacteroides sp.]|nr:hypothetical protein [Bacteroides sp.]
MPRIVTILAVLMAVVAAGCKDAADRTLDRAWAMVDVDPAATLCVLDSLGCSGLSRGQQARRLLLQIKARDKAYITHTSDSSVVEALEYFSSHGSAAEQTEALYYCARVYADLGDAPRALEYFDKALARVEREAPRSQLHLNVLFQKGALLRDMALYDQGVELIMQTIELDTELQDTFYLMMDYDHLAAAYLNMGELDKAEDAVRSAMRVRSLTDQEQATLQTKIAAITYERDSIAEALRLIRGLPERVEYLSRNYTLLQAAKIYWKAGIADSAVMYARQLLADGRGNKDKARKILLYASLQSGVSADSLRRCIDTYLDILVDRFQNRSEEVAVRQNALYNYAKYKADYAEAMRERSGAVIVCFILCGAVLLLIIAVLYQHWQRVKTKARMQEMVLSLNSVSIDPKETSVEESMSAREPDMESVRKDLLNHISEQGAGSSARTPSYIVRRSGSEGRRLIEEAVAGEGAIAPQSDLWVRMEEWVLSESADFTEKLTLLAGAPLTTDDYRLALMIRCGATPTDLTTLLGRDKSTVSKRRKALCISLFREKGDLRTMDSLIRRL